MPTSPSPRQSPPEPKRQSAESEYGRFPQQPPQGDSGSPDGRPPRRHWSGFLWLLVALLVVNWVIVLSTSNAPQRLDIPYSSFHTVLQRGEIHKVVVRGDEIQGEFDEALDVPNDGTSHTAKKFETRVPGFVQNNTELLRLLQKHHVIISAEAPQGRSLGLTLLLGFGPTLLLFGILFFVFRRMARMGGGMGGLGGLGRSRAKRYTPSKQRTTFDDVAGIDEAEQELVEIVDFLKRPDKYRRLGGAIPRGVLLSGPPGTGKTLLARAVAGEADVPFFSMSASEFVEMVVGVGASRVRDLFQEARKAAPAIVFIDELDAIGRQRGANSAMGGHDEREQTLNQILSEMDGFDGSEGVIVMSATNRPEILDRALLRPGRFDRRIAVQPPDVAGREAILEVHAKHVPLAADVSLSTIAASTPGMVGADLKNLINEAALTAARRDRDAVKEEDFMDALERIVLGAERKIMISRDERERTAYHESGHALLGMLQPGADPVRKITIVPRGRALGMTLQRPEADRYGFSETYLYGRIIGALGGRAAEELVYGDVTTGAENDLEQVTALARRMVGRWGMSEAIGPISVMPADEEGGGFGQMFPGPGDPSDSTRELIDQEVRRIVEECYERAVEELRGEREALDRLARRLLERETLDELEAYEVAGIRREHAVNANGQAALGAPSGARGTGADEGAGAGAGNDRADGEGGGPPERPAERPAAPVDR